MKYKVGKAYIHDGSEKCPLPKDSTAVLITDEVNYRYHTAASSWLGWANVLCFVPTFIPPQPAETWVVIDDQDNSIVCITYFEETARRNASNCDGRRVILMREVTE